MKPNLLKLLSFAFIIITSITNFYSCTEKVPEELPNILWLTSEDNSPFAGCYGDDFATTPNMDKLASEGFLYTHAYANAPVCAPARNTIITGVYANSGGNQHMRSFYKKGEEVRLLPQFLKEAGYYCTNNSKEDYNIAPAQTKGIWDESSKNAHYKNRKPGQPFFAVFNSTISHESCIHKSIPSEELRHDPKKVPIAPYHPRTEAMEHDWAQYYDKIEDMDTWLGKKLKELEEAGLAENTIVFYFSDHGGVLGRSKRFLYDSGTRVPFIVRIPKKYKHLFPGKAPNSKVGRLISFVDLAPTLLSITGIEIPAYMQGNAFLGKQKTPVTDNVYMFRGRMDERYDMSRSVRNKKFRYIQNYMPYRIYGQHLEYFLRAPSARSWKEAFDNGECNEIQSVFWNTKPSEELYDTENDPWEINNLAKNPEYKHVLEEMKSALSQWSIEIKDTGFIPEAERSNRSEDLSSYDYFRSGSFDLQPIIEAANVAVEANETNLDKLCTFLKNEDSAIRYWGATGLLLLGDKATDKIDELKKASQDKSANVSIVAAEALYKLGETSFAKKILLENLKAPNQFVRTHALNTIDCLKITSMDIQDGVINLLKKYDVISRKNYDVRASKRLIEEWGIDPSELNIEFSW